MFHCPAFWVPGIRLDAPVSPHSIVQRFAPTSLKRSGSAPLAYKQFRRFIDDYARVVNAKYTTAGALPEQSDEVSLVTDIWFKLTDAERVNDFETAA